MVKVRFDIADEIMRKLTELRQEEEKARRSAFLMEAIRKSVLISNARESGKLSFLRPNKTKFKVFSAPTKDELNEIDRLEAEDLASFHSRVDRELKQVLEQSRQAQARRGAQARHEKSPYAKIKALVMAEYEAHGAELSSDGQPLYKNQQSFIRTMMALHLDVADEQTIRGWIKKSPIVVPHWKTRARKNTI
ncbi:hypothetical protein [Paraburkholderia sp. MM5477-R1]|uniref:hypothetical protein n=1 Tax=Paraburkholderia sp. MM5477-R1 TaxID=2991062 RepID=UPI003D1FEDE0